METATEIAAALATPDSLTACPPWALAERALLYFYLNQVAPSDEHHDVCQRLLTHALADSATTQMSPWMYNGTLFVGWTHAHLKSDIDAADLYEAIDEPFVELLNDEQWRPPFDVLGGLAGLGVYWLERYPDPLARRGLERLIAHLESRAEQSGDETRWPTPWVLQFDPLSLPDPNDCFAMGMAHGVSGVIALLSRIHLAGVLQHRIAPLIERTLGWLLHHRREDATAQFPAIVGTHIEPKSYFGWCWGDIGLAFAVTLAARALQRRDWEALAVELGQHAAKQTHTVEDAGLCHGGVGNGHLFNRLYQLWDLPQLRDAARNWYDIGLGLRQPGEGTVGFYRTDHSGGAPVRYNDTQFLSGATGIALGLLAAGSATLPAWDRLMLLSDSSMA